MFYVSDAYIFNPLKFINGLLKYNKYPIYENTSIIDMKRCDDYYVCYTKFNKIKDLLSLVDGCEVVEPERPLIIIIF